MKSNYLLASVLIAGLVLLTTNVKASSLEPENPDHYSTPSSLKGGDPLKKSQNGAVSKKNQNKINKLNGDISKLDARIQELRSKIKKLEKKDKSHNEKSNNGVELVEYKS